MTVASIWPTRPLLSFCSRLIYDNEYSHSIKMKYHLPNPTRIPSRCITTGVTEKQEELVPNEQYEHCADVLLRCAAKPELTPHSLCEK